MYFIPIDAWENVKVRAWKLQRECKVNLFTALCLAPVNIITALAHPTATLWKVV